MNTPNAPWLKFYGDIPKTLEYPQISMYEAVVNASKTHSQVNAYEFQGKGTTYAKFIEKTFSFYFHLLFLNKRPLIYQ